MVKVAIAGYGVEGASAYKYFKSQGANITVFKERPALRSPLPPDVTLVTGKNCFAAMQGFDIVVRSPSIAPGRIVTDGQVTSVTREFFKVCPAPIIGITGSKGKGTTASFVYHMLHNAGIRAHLAGNIGVPALDILPHVHKTDVVVLELSSFQLWDLQQSPHIAIVLMVEQEHLATAHTKADVFDTSIHKDIDEYLHAKSSITRWQTSQDTTIYLPGNDLTKTIAMQGKAQKIPYTQPPGAHVKDGFFVMQDHRICLANELKLPGEHNKQNACAAITAAWQYTQNTQALAKALREFEGLDHRLKFVRSVNNVAYYDDSQATTPTSAIAALKAFGQPKVIILGGYDKGADFTNLAQTVALSKMRAVILIGNMRHRLHQALQKAGYQKEIVLYDEHTTMAQIVQQAASYAQHGDMVILSPACSSYDMFTSYKDRGDQFIAAVNAL